MMSNPPMRRVAHMNNPNASATCTKPRNTRAVLVLVALIALPANAQDLIAITVSNTGALAFGSIIAGSTGGTVTVPHDGSSRNCSADVTCLPEDPGSPAGFEVSGEALRSYTITLPEVASLSDGAGNSMPIDNFADSEGGTGSLNSSGNDSFTVGATLGVGAGQKRGDYSGTFDVTVEYE